MLLPSWGLSLGTGTTNFISDHWATHDRAATRHISGRLPIVGFDLVLVPIWGFPFGMGTTNWICDHCAKQDCAARRHISGRLGIVGFCIGVTPDYVVYFGYGNYTFYFSPLDQTGWRSHETKNPRKDNKTQKNTAGSPRPARFHHTLSGH